MKNQKVKRYKIEILVGFALLGIFVGGAIAILIYGLLGHKLVTWLLVAGFACTILGILDGVAISICFQKRRHALLEQASTSEYFLNDDFVYNETLFSENLEKRKKKHKELKGAVVCLGVRNLNSDILTLYGSERVKQINEVIFRCIYDRFHGHREYLYAFNVLDDFLLYKETDNITGFYQELLALATEINNALAANEGLPATAILVGSYEPNKDDTVSQMIERASYAEKFNASTRLSNDIVVFTKDMVKENNDRDLSYELNRALEEGQLEIFYQPKFDLKNNKFFGAEALIRWNHPLRGLLPPSLFIPFAEQSGKILEVDRYVFRHVCQDIQSWEKDKKRLLKISVNLSRRTVYDPGILTFFQKTMEEYHVNPLLIDIELTESTAAKDALFVTSIIKKIKAMGMSTSIDDFGVGYSSFSALRKIPFDTLKVDKTFIDDIEVDKKARDLVECVINLGHSLGMSVIGEGVQSEKQVEILKKLGLNSIQGFYYSQALTKYEFTKFIEKNKFEKDRGDKQ